MRVIELHPNALGWSIFGIDSDCATWSERGGWSIGGPCQPDYYETLPLAITKAVSLILMGEAQMGSALAARIEQASPKL